MLKINLYTKTLIKDNTVLIDEGIPINNYLLPDTIVTFEHIEELYKKYKYSVPNRIKYKKPYFKALSENQLTTKDLIIGENRQKAKEQLEFTLLIGILNGSLKWPNDKHWFWQSTKDPDLVLLKEWF